MTGLPNRAKDGRPGFTLVELLVVIAIIAVLIGLLLPAVQKVREAAAKSQCQNNLKQIGLALHNYHDTYSEFPPGGITEGGCCSTQSRTTWTISILPYLEQDPLYKRYDLSVTNENPANAFVRTQLVKTYRCPSDLTSKFEPMVPASGPGMQLNLVYMPGSYRAVSGRSNGLAWFDDPKGGRSLPKSWRGILHGVWANPTLPPGNALLPERFSMITDGTSNTLMVGEMTTKTRPQRGTFWAYTYTSYNQSSVTPQSRILLNDYERCRDIGGMGGENPCKRAFSSFHTSGLNFCLGDASVRFVGTSINMDLLADLATMGGGEVTGDF